jgi:hypothetical protein
MRITGIPSRTIQPVHEVRDAMKLAIIAESMEHDGWQGRPLLIVDTGDRYQGLTGSHRVAAAQRLDMDVPAVIIELDDWTEEVAEDFEFVRGDYDREAVLREHGLVEAANLMAQEIKANHGEW